jgi:DNA repair exonuclease SbcCD nuclease subunit
MQRTLRQLGALSETLGDLPIFCAGDIFDRWNSPPELINFAIEHIPPMIVIPGQHDLPHHQAEQLPRYALWTLVKSGAVDIIQHNDWFELAVNDTLVRVFGVWWGQKVIPSIQPGGKEGCVDIALVHKYVAYQHAAHPGSSKSDHVALVAKPYIPIVDIVAFGDNHIPFQVKVRALQVWNCGSLMRRNADQLDHEPCVGVVHSDASVQAIFLDVSLDKMSYRRPPTVEAPHRPVDVNDFLRSLGGLLDVSANSFTKALRLCLDSMGVHEETRRLIAEALEDE